MPYYDYKCDKCDEIMEIYHSINDKIEFCPKCQEKEIVTPIKRLISKSVSFSLIGSSWAKDGYK
jgi:putative FmdB family regulatory protein